MPIATKYSVSAALIHSFGANLNSRYKLRKPKPSVAGRRGGGGAADTGPCARDTGDTMRRQQINSAPHDPAVPEKHAASDDGEGVCIFGGHLLDLHILVAGFGLAKLAQGEMASAEHD